MDLGWRYWRYFSLFSSYKMDFGNKSSTMLLP